MLNDLLNLTILSSRDKLYRFTRKVLYKYGIRLKKKFSQNISIDPRYLNLISNITLSHNPKVILEVGTGIGFLTAALAYKCKSSIIISIEKDPRLYKIASETLAHLENVTLILGDALDYLSRARIELVASSLPFNVTSEALLAIARNNFISKAVLGIQKEVCERLKAKPGESSYGRLSVLIKLLFNVKEHYIFPPESFYPSPKVYISVVEFVRKKNYDYNTHKMLEKLTACLFSQKNKLAVKVLKRCIENPGEDILRKLEGRRVRDLAPEEIEEIVMSVKNLRNTT